MAYSLKEIFYSLQGEGAHAGRPSLFLRFAGCNLWSGREADRASAICRFCDTDFFGTDGDNGGTFDDADALAEFSASLWPVADGRRWAICTGGEPLLQLDEALILALNRHGFAVAVETNGTVAAPPGLDWICVSPKAGAPLDIRSGDELKLPFPQEGAEPDRFENLGFGRFYLQPIDGPELERNTRLALEYCLANPRWRLSLQTHKFLGIP